MLVGCQSLDGVTQAADGLKLGRIRSTHLAKLPSSAVAGELLPRDPVCRLLTPPAEDSKETITFTPVSWGETRSLNMPLPPVSCASPLARPPNHEYLIFFLTSVVTTGAAGHLFPMQI